MPMSGRLIPFYSYDGSYLDHLTTKRGERLEAPRPQLAHQLLVVGPPVGQAADVLEQGLSVHLP